MIVTNISSMQANQVMLNTNANNVANVNTDGFKPTDVKISNPSDGTLKANLRVTDDTGLKKSQTDLSKEMSDQIVGENVAAVNTTVIQTQDTMIGSLLDIKA